MPSPFPDSALRDLRRKSVQAMDHHARLVKDDPDYVPTLDPDTHQPTGTVPEVVVYDGAGQVTDDEAKLAREFPPETDLVGRAMLRVPVTVGPLDPQEIRVTVRYRGIERSAVIVEQSYRSVATYFLISWSDLGDELPRNEYEGVPA